MYGDTHPWASYEKLPGCSDIESKARALPAKTPEERDEIARSIRAACAVLAFPWLTATQIDNQIHSTRTSPEVREAMKDLKARILIQESDDGYGGPVSLAWSYLTNGVCAGRILTADPEKVVEMIVRRGRQGYVSARRLRQFINRSDALHVWAMQSAPEDAGDLEEWYETSTQGRIAKQAAWDNAKATELFHEIENQWRLQVGPEAMGLTDGEVFDRLIAVEPTHPILVRTAEV